MTNWYHLTPWPPPTTASHSRHTVRMRIRRYEKAIAAPPDGGRIPPSRTRISTGVTPKPTEQNMIVTRTAGHQGHYSPFKIANSKRS